MLHDTRETDSMKPNNMTYFRHSSPAICDQLKLPTIVAKQIADRTRADVTRIYRQSTIMSRPHLPHPQGVRLCSSGFNILDCIVDFAIFVRRNQREIA